jgi:TIR domain
MTLEQIYAAYPLADQKRVANIIRFLKMFGYQLYFDADKRFAGNDFMDTIRFEINNSHLFLIFISRNRTPKSVLNTEVEWIREAHRKLRNDPNIILVLLDDLADWEMPEYVETWLLNEGLTHVRYTPGRTAKAKKELLKALTLWAGKYKKLPPFLGSLARIKNSQQLQSKQILARWTARNFSTTLQQCGSVYIGPGSTVYDTYLCTLRNLFMNNSQSTNLFTNNEFLIFNENENRAAGKPSVPLIKVGDRYIQEYAAHLCSFPWRGFPEVTFSLISVSGFKLDSNVAHLRVCWEDLAETTKEVFVKTKEQILILASGSKIVESEGTGFIDLLPILVEKPYAQKRKLTMVIDTNIDPCNKDQFHKNAALLSKVMGNYQKNTRDQVFVWEKEF